MKRSVPLLVAALVLAPAAPALAGGSAADSAADDVVVTAAVRTPDGLVFRSRTATSAVAGEALAVRWDAERGVAAADVEHRVRALATDPHRWRQWGLTRLRAETSWATATGAGQVVAVVDTGVQGDHPDLAGQVLPPIDLVDRAATATVATDPEGHGTHVAGVVAALTGNGTGVAGLAHGARVLPVRVLDESGWGSDADVAEGIVRAVDAGATVVNLSLGGPDQSRLLQEAVGYALGKGVVVVAASGNDGPGKPAQYPAATPGVIAVGAVDARDAVAGFSSTGPHVALVAPGVDIASTLHSSQYAYMDGTSMAAPFVAAAAAQLRQAGVPARDVRARLVATAEDLGAPGRDDASGAGLLDVVAALTPATATPAAAPVPAAAPAAPVVAAPEVAAPVVAAPVVAPPVVEVPLPAAPVVTAPVVAPAPVAAPVVELPVPVTPVPVAEVPPAPAPPVAVVPPAPAPVPAAPVPQPTPAAGREPAPLVLRLAASAATVEAGSPVVLRARVLRDGAAAPDAVVLERRTTGGWAAVRSGTAGPDGLVAWSLRPDRAGEHRVRAGGATSAVVRVDVRQRVTAGARGGAVSGQVQPGGRAPVVLERLRAGAWAAVSRTTTDAAGRYRVGARLPRGTVVRVVAPARPGLLRAASGGVRL